MPKKRPPSSEVEDAIVVGSTKLRVEKAPEPDVYPEAPPTRIPAAKDLTLDDVIEGLLSALYSARTAAETVAVWKEIAKLKGFYDRENRPPPVRSQDDLKTLPDPDLEKVAGFLPDDQTDED